ncbi:MAG: hypothetical protein VX738_10830 [Planctomycetota bacterium]|nr:hypothetical protein [Planctomycetota bacterium]
MPDQVEYYGWYYFWVTMLWSTLTIFTIMSVVVTYRGWKEIRIMLSRLSDSQAEQTAVMNSAHPDQEP